MGTDLRTQAGILCAKCRQQEGRRSDCVGQTEALRHRHLLELQYPTSISNRMIHS